MVSIHIFEITDGKETGKHFNGPIRGKENLKGKSQRMKFQCLRFWVCNHIYVKQKKGDSWKQIFRKRIYKKQVRERRMWIKKKKK